ncbi:hypothetical protein JHK85_019147 [Glycine max]|nr:hypothetical protein JHK85_019147 [Glycine max]
MVWFGDGSALDPEAITTLRKKWVAYFLKLRTIQCTKLGNEASLVVLPDLLMELDSMDDVDDFHAFKQRMLGTGDKKPPLHRRALLFVDNAGHSTWILHLLSSIALRRFRRRRHFFPLPHSLFSLAFFSVGVMNDMK